MKKQRYSALLALFLALFVIAPGASGDTNATSVTAQAAVDPQQALGQAWARVAEAGSYRYLSTADQTLVPRPIPGMIGQGDVRLTLESDGAVMLPNRSYVELRVAGAGQEKTVALLHDGARSYMLQDGALAPVDDALSLATPTNDVLGYLAAAEQVTLLEPPEGRPDVVRYGFGVSGPLFAEYVRRQAEASMRAEPGAPDGLTLRPAPALQTLSGHGELWINRAGLPVRQVLDIRMPAINEAYGAHIRLVSDLSAHGQVEALPRAVQGADGTWRLEGQLRTGAVVGAAASGGMSAPSGRALGAVASAPTLLADDAPWRERIWDLLPLRVDRTDLALLMAVVVIVLTARYYRRNPRRCYTLIVVAIVPIMVFSSLLQAGQVLLFVDRQAQAAKARAAATPDLLRSLGLQVEETQADAGSAADPAKVVAADRASGSTGDSEPAPASLALAAPLGAARAALQVEGGYSALQRCGDGEPGVDTDGDGIDDQVELCLGTSPTNPDTDGDGIDDRTELEGFDLGGQHWDSDPLSPDSNRDGNMDSNEWPRSLATNGLAADADLDGDGIPNLWDDDDDGDGVPDALDLSRTALTDYTTAFTLSTSGRMVTGTQAIEFALQPQNMDHLRYSTTALDWPFDDQGNIQDLDNSTADLRLLPFLLVTTNIAPSDELMAQYGVRSWIDDEGRTVLLVTLQPLGDGGASYAFYGKVAYGAEQTGDIQWDAKLVWMAEVQQDRWGWIPHPEWRVPIHTIITEPIIAHQYQETFRVTGLQITKSEGYEAMVLGTPGMAGDDRHLFQAFLGLSSTYGSAKTLDGQDVASGETALGEIAERFAVGYAGDQVSTFNIPADVVAVTQPVVYPNAEAGMAGLANEQLPQFLYAYPAYSSVPLCEDAEGNPVRCATLLVATESHSGVQDLSDLAGADPRIVGLDRLHVNLDDVPLVVARGVNLRMYERDDITETWRPMMPARILEVVEARYGGAGGAYSTTLTSLYPMLRSQDWRFVAYAAYLWAYAGRMLAVSIDGQALVPEDIDEEAAAGQYTVPEFEIDTVLAYMGVATGLPSLMTDSYSVFTAGFNMVDDLVNRAKFLGSSLGKANLAGHLTLAGLGAACSLASVVMGSINMFCANHPEKGGCKNEAALLAANLAIGSLSIVVQTTAIVYNIAEAAVKHLKVTMQNFSVSGSVLGWIGAGIGIVMTWVSFGIMAAHGGSNPIAWRVALGMAIMTTIWLVALALINMIPVVGPIISAILALIDYIIGLFTGLFSNETWSIAKVVLEMFYDARVCTSLEAAQFGEFNSRLEAHNEGLVGGNKYILELPGSGTIVKETEGADRGTNDDLRRSYVKSALVSLPIANGFVVSNTTQPEDCQIIGGKLECTNVASLGVNLEPRVNGAFSIFSRMLYQTVWAEYTLWAVRVKTHEEPGYLPEEDPEPTTVYLDVLPATLTELWHWSALGNPDRDGDGLTNDEEAALGTDPDNWDTDGDGLSDYYEIMTESARGANVLLADTDGDGLSDALERRAGTRPNVADSDGDGLTDGEELRHVENGVLVGGWQVTLASGLSATDVSLQQAIGFTVSSDPLVRDDDADTLNAWEEREHGLSPQATNAIAPVLGFSAGPLADIPDGRPGMYWLPGTDVAFTIHLGNWAYEPVTTTLSLTLPSWLDTIGGGVMGGNRSPAMVQDGNTLSWSFTGGNALQIYEAVSTTVTARVDPNTTSGRGLIPLELVYKGVQLRKLVDVIVDGDDPNVAIMAPSDGAYLRSTSYVVGGSATDATTWITEASLSIVPQGNPAEFTALNASTGVWAYTWSLPGDGVYSLQARATDAMGHQKTVGPVNVTVDNTPPTASLAYEMAATGVHLSGTASDNLAGVRWVQLGIDGQPWRSVPFDDSSWSYDWTVGAGAQGKHVVRVRAIDRCGNVSAVVSQEIIVDRVAPSSIVNAGADPDVPVVVKASSTFTLTGVADEGGHLPLPAAPTDLRAGLDVLDDSTVWLGLSSIHDNDGGVLAAWVGDFNADRLSDLAVGLPGPEGDAGMVALLYGSAGGWPVPPDMEMLSYAATRYTGAPGARLGSLLAAAGDVNGDNMDDLLIGERDASRAFVVFGKPGLLGATTLEAGQPGYRTMLQAPATIERLAGAGDVDGDGDAELLVVAGGTAYLVLGRGNPWPETLDVAAEAVATWAPVTGALGVGDVDNDQLAEWATLAAGSIILYGWNASGGVAELVTTVTTADADPRAVALGDVDGDGHADWLYADGGRRILVYGSGAAPHTFSDMDGFAAAPGDVDGDGRADILLTTAEGVATLVRQPAGGSPEVFATVTGVGGAANAPYAAGADLNADGSSDLLLIPNEAAAEARGFDAPDFGSGFISPLALPLGASSAGGEGGASMGALSMGAQSIGPDTRYVDDDAVDGVCDGHSQCYETIQEAVNLSDGGGDTIIVYPGVYDAFRVPAGANYDHLTIAGVSADAVFVKGGTSGAIEVAADGVHLSNLTVRDAPAGVVLEAGAGEATWAGGEETVIDHLVVHSVRNPIAISQAAALKVRDSTLVGNGTDPIIAVGSTPNAAVHTWNGDRTMTAPIGMNGALVVTGDTLYALPGGTSNTVYTSTPGADGTLGSWTSAFKLQHDMPLSDGTSTLAAGGNYLYQMHPVIATPDFGTFNGDVRAVALAPNGDIYVAGSFSQIGTFPANNIARWDGTQWYQLGTQISNGTDGPVYALTIDSNGNVYVGGDFDRVFHGNEVPAHNIARWDGIGSAWHPLGEAVVGGNGVSGESTVEGETIPEGSVAVYALAHTDDDVVLVGGRFRSARDSASSIQTVWNFAFYRLTPWPDTGTNWRQFMGYYGGVGQDEPEECIRNLVWGGGLFQGTPSPNYTPAGKLYAGGDFTRAGDYAANNVAYFQYSSGGGGAFWHPFGDGVSTPVAAVTWDAVASKVYAVSDDANAAASIYSWDGATWSAERWHTQPGDVTVTGSTLVADPRGNVYAGMVNGDLRVLRAGDLNFDTWSAGVNEGGRRIWALTMDGRGQVLTGRGSGGGLPGSIKRWTMEGLLRRNLSGTSWETFRYPSLAISMSQLPTAVVVDDAGNAYANFVRTSYSVVQRFNAVAKTWEIRASLSDGFISTGLAWADGYLYGLGYSDAAAGENWYLYRHNPAAAALPGVSGTAGWAQLGLTPLPAGANTGVDLSWTWDGADAIYVLAAGGYYRYRIGANVWDTLPNPSVSFTVAHAPALARAGNNLYVYATPDTGVTTSVFRYGAVGMPDLRLTVERTALVMPESAGDPMRWTNQSAPGGTYRFQIDTDATNEWVGPSGATWSPALPAGATTLTSAEAAFVAPVDGLYRLSADSTLTAGYHRYMAVAHVYPSEAACAECASGDLTWGVTAFATIREAVESGAARVLVHPGRYPQTFYLVSGVEVIGSGAESTIIEPPAGAAATLVAAEGAAGASLARMTLAGGAGWDGFLAEGGAEGLTVTRCIFRDLDTALTLREGSTVEVVNNTIVRNTNGLVAEDTTPVNVRNTILAYHTGAGLQYGGSATNTYNSFWGNAVDMDPSEVSLGSLFVDPRFRNLAGNDLRLVAGSPLIDMGAPGDPTVPGGGARIDIGYAEHNAAGFYVSPDYSETALNDGLTWGIDAFGSIQAALDAAAAALYGLQGAVPDGGFSVAVDAGTYAERVTVPSHVRLVGSGAEVTTIDAGNAGSAVTFDGVIAAELSDFTLQNASAGGAGVDLDGAASNITIARNVVHNNAGMGVRLAGRSSGAVRFNTIVGNADTGVYATGAGTWVEVYNNILDGNGIGLQAASGALIRNDHNLLHNTTDVSGVTAGANTIMADPAFADASHYILTPDSPALDAADPLADVPLAGGVRADLGYKELTACPLTLLLGPQVASAVTGNSGVGQVEVALVPVGDASQPVTATLPTVWETLLPPATDQALFYWQHPVIGATPGLYRVYSRATDAVGNVEEEETDWYEGALVVDDTAPTVTWGATLPASTDAAAVLAVAQVDGTVTTGTGTRSDVDQVYFSVTGPAETLTYPAEGGRTWVPLPTTGSYTISAVAVDEAGNQAVASASVAVSSGSSVATVSNLAANGSVNDTAITLRGYVRFTAGGAGRVDVAVTDGATVQATLDTPGAAFSAWSAAITLPEGDGPKTVTVTPILAGTSGTATTLNLTLDTTAPTLAVATPGESGFVRHTAEWTGTASDAGSGLARVEVSMDGGYTWERAAVSEGAWSLNHAFGERLDHVTYPARVRAIDEAGNVTLLEWPVAVDSVPPSDLAPVSFSAAEGQHLEIGTSLSLEWNTPQDGGGSAQVMWAVDQSAETDPSTVADGTSATVTLDAIGDWYAHLIARDAAGNEVIARYGPWHVRDMGNTTFSERRQSIVLDGFIDLAHDEWLAGDLLGTDAQGLQTQRLYASWDGEGIYLGWSGAWWTLDGAMWAYLDVADGGSTQTVSGAHTLPIAADLAVLIDGPDEGGLYAWDGGGWALSAASLAFAHGSSGDTEALVPWNLAAGQTVQLVAFALPTEASASMMALAAGGGGMQLAAVDEGQPWAIFPNTNALGQQMTTAYSWNTPDVGQMNDGQPTARTVTMDVGSPQASGTAWCPGSTLEYEIELRNPESTAFTDLTIALTASEGLGFQTVTGATRTTGAEGDPAWTLAAPALGAGETAKIVVTAKLASELSGLTEVSCTINLSAGAELTGPTVAIVTHRVDGSAPTVAITALAGSAITGGSHTFTGSSNDGHGSGVARVEVSLNGANWHPASGTLAWTTQLDVPSDVGEVTLQARAVDGCGRVTDPVGAQTFYVDQAPPEVSWTVPGVITATAALLKGSTSDPAPQGALVGRVEVQIDADAADWLVATGPYAPLDGVQGWNYTWRPPHEDGVTHQLRARAADGAGNATTTDWSATIVDIVAPAITVTTALASVSIGSGSIEMRAPDGSEPEDASASAIDAGYDGPILAGTVSDGSGVEAVRIWVYAPSGSVFVEDATLTVEGWEYRPDLASWEIGDYALRVQAIDIYGNTQVYGPHALQLGEEPIAGLQALSDGPKPPGETVTLTATISAGTHVTYTWDLGDGAVADGQIVTHAYAAPGLYTATVTATNTISQVNASVAVLIEAPVTGLVASNDGPVVLGEEATLSATIEAGTNVIYDWTFGDGETGSGASVTHQYPAVGSYVAEVTAHNSISGITATTTVVVAEPIAGLQAHTSAPAGVGVAVEFSATITAGSAVIYTWDYGDGEADSGKSVTHAYAAAGTYTATVTATNDVSQDDASVVVLVEVPVSGLVASNDGAVTLGGETTLSATIAAGSNVIYDWTFGDGATGGGATVTHQYPAVGSYVAEVTAHNSISSITAATTVLVKEPGSDDEPIVGLQAHTTAPEAVGAAVAFSVTISAGTNVLYAWDYGDGETGAGREASHTYAAAGLYTATVTAMNGTSRAEASVAVLIEVPVSGVRADNDGPTPRGGETTLAATVEAGTNVVYDWAFGDGDTGSGATVTHRYTAPGSYIAEVTGHNSISSITATTTVVVEPESEPPSPTRVIHLPAVMRTYAHGPDLVVTSIRVDAEGIAVTVRNDGNAPVVGSFWVDLYVAPREAPTAVGQMWQDLGEWGMVWGVTGDALPLPAGASLVLRGGDALYAARYSVMPERLPAGTEVYAQVDSVASAGSYGAVLEIGEMGDGPSNNIAGPVTLSEDVDVYLEAADADGPGMSGRPEVR